MKKTLTIAIVTALASPALAFAQPQHNPINRGIAKRFEKLDQNSDGSVSLDELKASVRSRFARLDGDGDGTITQVEASAHRAALADTREAKRAERDQKRVQKLQALFEKRDDNDDGRLSRDELGGSAKRFARLDADGDGYLTADELAAKRKAKADRRATRRHKLEARAQQRGAKRFQRVDGNGDGSIDSGEIDTLATQRFEKLDGNGDGKLERSELGKRKSKGEVKRKARRPLRENVDKTKVEAHAKGKSAARRAGKAAKHDVQG